MDFIFGSIYNIIKNINCTCTQTKTHKSDKRVQKNMEIKQLKTKKHGKKNKKILDILMDSHQIKNISYSQTNSIL
ncbi:hypothetical protein BKH41_09270 [Helicobacter sp. 12S02232-10]|nr:hypothetical protein BKH41_09270 [Helicobacter sp. 12S02232-10]